MAEVGQRLAGGVNRFSAFRSGRTRPVCSGESGGSSLGSCSHVDHRGKKEPAPEPRVLPRSKCRAARRKLEKLPRGRKGEAGQVDGTSASPNPICPASTGSVGSRDVLLDYDAALCLSSRPLQVRVSPWTRGAVLVHPADAFSSPQRLRAFCTVVFLLAGQRSERPGSAWRRLKPHPGVLHWLLRTYSSTSDAPLLYRSRTAYYDILKVTPSATQSQIKTAYYKQSFIYHPDKNPGSEEATERFTEISEAYTVLGNISLRRKYDRGLLSRSDIQSAGRPSSKEAPSKHTGSPQQQQQHQQRARNFSQTGGKTMFDFDAFYRAHYGEQLQRERYNKAMRQRMKEKQQQEELKMWKQQKILEVTLVVLLASSGLFLLGFK